MFRPIFLASAALLWILLACAPAKANVMLSQTRVVFHARDRDQSIQLMNVSDVPMLTQIWLDDGNSGAGAAQSVVPFVVTPPMSRIDPRQSQTLRIVYTGEPLPADRESVFWLNILEVPPKVAHPKDANILEISIRNRIKVIYRPTSLTSNPRAVMASLRWRRVKNADVPSVEAVNPTGYNMALANLQMVEGGHPTGDSVNTDIPPFTTKIIKLGPGKGSGAPVPAAAGAPTGVRYSVVDDLGAYVSTTSGFAQ